MFDDLDTLIKSIKSAKTHDQFQKYIDFIRFPFYRNVEINTCISFEFPFTVFIGQNGCGKSSTLHALYGCVEGKTPSDFWFETKVDPIQYYDDEKRRHSFWYSYKDDNHNEKQVVKARIRRKGDPNYWETSRPLVWAGMRKIQKNKRNSPIQKHVVYLDFRSELSAFDKFFYFGNVDKLKSKNRQEYLRKKSGLLKKILDEEKSVIQLRGKTLNNQLEKLNDYELKIISFILGRKYESAKALNHKLFQFDGYSVLYKTNHASYSEAFAGSGEMAIVRLVREVLKAPNYSLILLDEPEVSLHPGAQDRLKIFLLDQVKTKKHQVILTTHSPTIVKGLPKEAIKVFYQNPNNGRFIVKKNLLPEEAFFHIGFPIENKIQITVEDKLCKNIIDTVLEEIGRETANTVEAKYHPGGQSVIKKEFITVYCRNSSSKEFIVFDGDQRPSNPHINWRHLTINSLNDLKELSRIVKEQTGCDINFSVDGGSNGGNREQRFELYKNFLDYYLNNVFYLPEDKPEDIIWDSDRAKQLICYKKNIDELMKEIDSLGSTKAKFAFISKIINGSDTANDIEQTHKIFINYWKEQKPESYSQIETLLNKILGRD